MPTPGGPNNTIEGRKYIVSLFRKGPNIPFVTSSCPTNSSNAIYRKLIHKYKKSLQEGLIRSAKGAFLAALDGFFFSFCTIFTDGSLFSAVVVGNSGAALLAGGGALLATIDGFFCSFCIVFTDGSLLSTTGVTGAAVLAGAGGAIKGFAGSITGFVFATKVH